MKNSKNSFILGINELDEKLGDVLKGGAVISIVGAPGTGKTTLAATICYSNALKSFPCLYASMLEFKDKFYENFARLGLNFRELENRGLVKFVTLTTPGTSEVVEEIINMLEKEIISGNIRVLVIDPLTPLLRVVEGSVVRRALLQNNIYTLAKLLNGLIVATIEETRTEETTLADVEYTSDIVIRLHIESNKGSPTRFATFVKTRGAQILPIKIPFIIEEGRRIRFWLLSQPKEIPSPIENSLLIPCDVLRNILKEVSLNSSVSMISIGKPIPLANVITLIYAVMIANNLNKVLIFSYRLPAKKVIDKFREVISECEGRAGIADKLVNDRVLVKSINPSSMSLHELYAEELNTIKEYDPNVVVFLDTQIPEDIHMHENRTEYLRLLRNQVLYVKQAGRLLMRFGNYLLEEQPSIKLLNLVSDVIISLSKDKMVIQISYGDNVETSAETFGDCLRECVDFIRKQVRFC